MSTGETKAPPAITMCECRSSNIESHGYCAETKRMAVRFRNGSHFHYADVPHSVYQAFAKAKSKGTFFHDTIRSVFKASQVGAAPKSKKRARRRR